MSRQNLICKKNETRECFVCTYVRETLKENTDEILILSLVPFVSMLYAITKDLFRAQCAVPAKDGRLLYRSKIMESPCEDCREFVVRNGGYDPASRSPSDPIRQEREYARRSCG